MIVGMHVSLYYASWRAARQALVNCFLPKANYCKEFGIDIDDSEWPCAHIPKELVCDNGEMIGIQPKKALIPMTKLSFTPPYRPDCKGVVEKRFDILNDKVLHELLGTTKGGNVVRGSRDPRKDAIYTLREVSIEIIKAVREHNRTLFDDLAFSSPLMVENDLSPTPLNYWKIHIAKHRHELQSATSNDVIARLLPPAEVSVTRSGIQFNGLYYSCAEVEERELCSIARTAGQWRLEARIDENTSNYIYVRLDKDKGFVRCNLLPRSRMFSDKAMCESDLIKDWLESTINNNKVESLELIKEDKNTIEKHCCELLRQGNSMIEVSRLTGKSRCYIKHLALRKKIPVNLKPRVLTEELKAKIAKMAHKGFHRYAIAKKYNVSAGSVEMVISTTLGLVQRRQRCKEESMCRRYKTKIMRFRMTFSEALRKHIKIECSDAFFGCICMILNGLKRIYQSQLQWFIKIVSIGMNVILSL
ncbi:Mu transposase C-terminal domain-containing protein [Psychromonas sp. B3M02]|uniref:Mu transposase C-terminal domain-containing protein n=1 Tax=Psychromonas sp. B3M02 TaxID=2267226 RepID=UPI001C68B620|nr:Mu transposase C-terminal domain-containing protein [Psychromonas sp. B3M02]